MSGATRTAVLADPLSRGHDPGPGHPEQPARFDAALRGIAPLPLHACDPRDATDDELALCHSRKYIATAQREIQAGLKELSTGDTQVGPGSLAAAVRAVGTALTAVDLVLTGEARNAFCATRPPGHHATPDRGMGFCVFNNIALAARYAQRKHGIGRVLIADWDVHHGNGTQDIFYDDDSVFFFSTHQSPWYPGTGAAGETGSGKAEGRTLNCPLPAGSGMAEIGRAFEERLVRAMQSFQPELVLISAGFDSRLGDPLGNFQLTDSDFAQLTTILLELADQYASGRVVSILEGGYNLDGLSRALHSHVTTLASA